MIETLTMGKRRAGIPSESGSTPQLSHSGRRLRDRSVADPSLGRNRIKSLIGRPTGAVDDEIRRKGAAQTMEQSVILERLSHIPVEPNPVLLEHAQKRAESVQNRIADRITAFAGSMWFVYIHIIWFSSWIGFGVEGYPYGLLTMIVSLEAIFLSTFVMISQNRADAKRQVIADQQWQTVKEEDNQNEELIHLSNQILDLTKEIHSFAKAARPSTN